SRGAHGRCRPVRSATGAAHRAPPRNGRHTAPPGRPAWNPGHRHSPWSAQPTTTERGRFGAWAVNVAQKVLVRTDYTGPAPEPVRPYWIGQFIGHPFQPSLYHRDPALLPCKPRHTSYL